MLSISSTQRYFIYSGLTDMRKGFDSLCGLVREEFKMNPLSGDVFIFLSRTKNKIKLLQWQRDGFAIYYKRLEKGTFELPQSTAQNAMLITFTTTHADHGRNKTFFNQETQAISTKSGVKVLINYQ